MFIEGGWTNEPSLKYNGSSSQGGQLNFSSSFALGKNE